MLNYTYTKYKDVHTLTNMSANSMGYTIRKDVCGVLTDIQTSNLAPSATVTLNFKVDGIYSILPYDFEETGSPFTIVFYENLLKSFLASAERILCNCAECDECGDCLECQDYVDTYVKAISYNIVQGSIYTSYIEKLNAYYKCEYIASINCEVIKEFVKGNYPFNEAMLRTLEQFYVAFYYKDIISSEDEGERAYYDTKYKCIKKLKTRYADLVAIFEDNPTIFFWQMMSSEQDLSDIFLNLDQDYLNTKAGVSNLDVFSSEVGVTINYNLEGRIAFAIQPTPDVAYTITDETDTDLTDQFDSQYDPELNVLIYLSKIDFVVGPVMTFKIKKN